MRDGCWKAFSNITHQSQSEEQKVAPELHGCSSICSSSSDWLFITEDTWRMINLIDYTTSRSMTTSILILGLLQNELKLSLSCNLTFITVFQKEQQIHILVHCKIRTSALNLEDPQGAWMWGWSVKTVETWGDVSIWGDVPDVLSCLLRRSGMPWRYQHHWLYDVQIGVAEPEIWLIQWYATSRHLPRGEEWLWRASTAGRLGPLCMDLWIKIQNTSRSLETWRALCGLRRGFTSLKRVCDVMVLK